MFEWSNVRMCHSSHAWSIACVCVHTAVCTHAAVDLLVCCILSTCTVSLTKFASRSVPVKVHLKKKSGGRKTRRCYIENQIPYRTPSSFWLRFFFGEHFYWQTPGTDLHHTVSMVGVTDPGISGAWLGWGSYLSEFISEYIDVHLQKKHTSEHPCQIWDWFWNSKSNFGLERTFKIFKNLQKQITASGVCQGHSTKFSMFYSAVLNLVPLFERYSYKT
jgi:hypothetical protein